MCNLMSQTETFLQNVKKILLRRLIWVSTHNCLLNLTCHTMKYHNCGHINLRYRSCYETRLQIVHTYWLISACSTKKSEADLVTYDAIWRREKSTWALAFGDISNGTSTGSFMSRWHFWFGLKWHLNVL